MHYLTLQQCGGQRPTPAVFSRASVLGCCLVLLVQNYMSMDCGSALRKHTGTLRETAQKKARRRCSEATVLAMAPQGAGLVTMTCTFNCHP